uniref:BED-type domain-containing protein n=1 Tax=Caenorhabditis tropicalis TaxID=1561998 RepID=A0A1I7TH03_9PELO
MNQFMEQTGIPSEITIDSSEKSHKRTKRGSKYDEYFTKMDESAECKICGTKVAWTKKSGTNSLRLHLSTRHKEDNDKLMLDGIEIKRRKGLIDTPPPIHPLNSPLNEDVKIENELIQQGTTGPWNEHPQVVSELDYSIISMICRDQLPINMLGGRGFVNFMRLAAPQFDLKPVFHYVQRILPTIVFNIKEKIRYELSYQSKLTFTVDTYSPDNSMTSFVAIHAFHTNPSNMIPKKILIDYKVFGIDEFNIDSVHEIIQNLVDAVDRNLTITFHPKLLKGRKVPGTDEGILSSFDGILDTMTQEIFHDYSELISNQKRIVMEQYTNEPLTWKNHLELLQNLFKTSTSLTKEEERNSRMMYDLLKEIQETTSSIHHQHYPTASIIIPTLRVLSSRMEQLRGRNSLEI